MASVDSQSLFVVGPQWPLQAAFVVDLPLRVPLPVVVVEILLGIVVGPQVPGILFEFSQAKLRRVSNYPSEAAAGAASQSSPQI